MSDKPKPHEYVGPLPQGEYKFEPVGEVRFEDGKAIQTLRLLNVAGNYLIEAVVARQPTLEKGPLLAMWQHLDGAMRELEKARKTDNENAALAALTSLEMMANQIRLALSRPPGHE
jgi:hypothetical protein